MGFRGARFWWDRVDSDEKSANGDPEIIARALDGYFDNGVQPDLRHAVINGSRRHFGIIIPPRYAFFMRGTTAELTKALVDAKYVSDGTLKHFMLREPWIIRYFRAPYRDLTEGEAYTETVMGISGLQSYWREKIDSPVEQKGWKNLAWWPYGDLNMVQIPWLVSTALPACKRNKELGPVEGIE